MIAKEVAELADLLWGGRRVGRKWVLSCNLNHDVSIVLYKASLVTKGSAQLPGANFGEVWAPTGKRLTLRGMLALQSLTSTSTWRRRRHTGISQWHA